MKACLGEWIHVFLTLVLVGVEWSTSRPGRITAGEGICCFQWLGWVGTRTGVDNVEKRKIWPLLGAGV